MKNDNIDVSNVKKADERNGHAIIQISEKGENSIFVYSGSNGTITKDFADSVLLKFSKGDFLVVQNEINMVDYIVNEAHKKGMVIFFNPSPCNEEAEKINLNFVDYLLFNEVEGEMLTGENEPKKIISFLREKYPNLKGVLTLGEKGSVYFDGKNEASQSAFFVEAVDTTAAGDTFSGYFIAQISKGESVEDALKLASAASAIAVSKKGASTSVPYEKEVKSAVFSMKECRQATAETALAERIDKYIEKNLKKSSIAELSGLLGYSVSHTQKTIKKLYNKPFSKIVQEKCCAFTAKMLSETDLPVGEIIAIIGYENESFFRNIFKEKYGKSMLEYRTKGEKQK